MKEKFKKALSNFPILFSILRFIRNMVIDYPKWLLFKIAKNWVILNRISMGLRPFIWKLTGVNIKGKVNIGYDVYYDVNCAKLITIEDGAWISPGAKLLCHKRDISNYYVGDDYNKQPFVFGNIHLKKDSSVGLGAIIMPGVVIGEGTKIGAGAVVTKSIPDWSIAVGNPAKVIKQIPKRDV